MEVPEYELPEAAIAQQPTEPRDSARLLDATDPTPDRSCTGGSATSPSWSGPGDVLVVNTSRVLPARLRLTKATGGAAEVLLLEPDLEGGPGVWQALVRPGRRLAPGTVLAASPSGQEAVEVGERLSDGRRRVRLLGSTRATCWPPAARWPCLPTSTSRSTTPSDTRRCTPTSRGRWPPRLPGLHLTRDVLEHCRIGGAEVHGVDLAVGLATFRPLAGRPGRGSRHAHRALPGPGAAPGRPASEADRVIAVGTTTVRALETAAATGPARGAEQSVHPGRFRLRRGGRADDELPPAPVQPAGPAGGLLRTALAPALRGSPRSRGTASCPLATP